MTEGDLRDGFQTQLATWRSREHGNKKLEEVADKGRVVRSSDAYRPNPFTAANGDGGNPNPFANVAASWEPVSTAAQTPVQAQQPARNSMANGSSSAGGGGAGSARGLVADAAAAIGSDHGAAAREQLPQKPSPNVQQPQQEVQQQHRREVHPAHSAASHLDQYFLPMGSVVQPSADGLQAGRFGLTDTAALADNHKVRLRLNGLIAVC